ncbi:hypothetical protein H6F75_00345 [Nodosilinea sp. FACHB-131]|uniref:hypothetical protein n=1 Tax=Cyanophyceae TaxID=3028117 RepID=UPI001685579F|nr:hypothetical protein [Nodosilinea sp. FACHB-131]MBD1871919.1 hypothetical protein [Nodosilinea sp. FACHB-131]
MAVDREYVARLKQWADEGVDRCQGLNAFARETATRLERHGLKGIASGMISRWRREEIFEPVDDRTLTRIGLLKNFSANHDEARRLAREWLEGDIKKSDDIPTAQYPVWHGVDAVPYELLKADELVELAARSVGRLGELVQQERSHDAEEPPAPQPEPNTVTSLLLGKMQLTKLDVEGLAIKLGVEPDRAAAILEGHLMNCEECRAAADFTGMTVETLVDWGGCIESALLPVQPVNPAG